MEVFSKEKVFSFGSQLWILPDSENSSWTSQIDWYMNFHIFRMYKRVPRGLTEKARKMLKASRLPVPELSFQRDHLLISSSPYLPNEWCVLIEKKGKGMAEWYEQVLRVWRNFQFPSLRLFLPMGACLEDWMHFLQQSKLHEKDMEYSVKEGIQPLSHYTKRITLVPSL